MQILLLYIKTVFTFVAAYDLNRFAVRHLR